MDNNNNDKSVGYPININLFALHNKLIMKRNPSRKPGRLALGNTPMTNAERQARHRLKSLMKKELLESVINSAANEIFEGRVDFDMNERELRIAKRQIASKIHCAAFSTPIDEKQLFIYTAFMARLIKIV